VRRRQFITLVGGAAVWPLAARAQRRGPMIAALTGNSAYLAILKNELAKLGWVEGRNIRFEWRDATGVTGDPERYARELISQNPDVVLAVTTPVLAAFQQLTHSIPIVFVAVSDPVSAGFVPSLVKPGGNITGFSNFEYAISAKWLELLKESAPGVTRAGIVLGHNDPSWARYLAPIESAAPAFGVQLSTILLEERGAIESATNAFAREPNGGLIILPNSRANALSEFLAGLAARLRLPAINSDRRFPAAGGLMSYGIDSVDLYRRAVPYIDRILRGEKPADLPVQQPTKFEFVINLKTVKALGLKPPPGVLAIADEVIE
jgi:putative tryptophan/tyrosine transport system substrate-binding protein